jgi:hypothetical protein
MCGCLLRSKWLPKTSALRHAPLSPPVASNSAGFSLLVTDMDCAFYYQR